MADSFLNEVPKALINLKPGLHTDGADKKTELPLKLLVAGGFSNGLESAPLSERKKVNLNNNFAAVLSEYSPKINPVMHDIKAPSYEKHSHLEQIELCYGKNTWSYKDGYIVHSDSWNECATE
ncbi:hypothetical protein C3432_17020 [Citrobacter amalonaticus]|uniref:Type VI secretion system tube protein Hcp n=1 Tax=Citrobacter amalonaticus TaxID=35703 RepID=A0A2S4RU30_CITAM|nr:type VI secretion system contractile sheath small subunit [Citrobacter amalonaticus]POT57067.1 hypothetical protein C3432_17020 [Citrobacter amalonaticus]POT72644.1 hypothetical protein C3436_20865 [Citrobacter amalonaticus]POU63499.1 hypothetical protein C3430_19120 [Citrobacter amalonaticus]POV03263.1 hypothetical protein C3424_22035 [Citrobacter amalonaticus]